MAECGGFQVEVRPQYRETACQSQAPRLGAVLLDYLGITALCCIPRQLHRRPELSGQRVGLKPCGIEDRRLECLVRSGLLRLQSLEKDFDFTAPNGVFRVSSRENGTDREEYPRRNFHHIVDYRGSGVAVVIPFEAGLQPREGQQAQSDPFRLI